MSRTKASHAADWAIGEVEAAQEGLYVAANELSRVRPSDPLVPQLGSLAEQCQAILSVLKKRVA